MRDSASTAEPLQPRPQSKAHSGEFGALVLSKQPLMRLLA